MEHDTLPNLFSVFHMHLLYVSVAHKSKMEVSTGVAKTGARLALDDATQKSRNILAVTSSARSPDQLSRYLEAGQPTLRRMVAIRLTHLHLTSKAFM